MSTRIRLTAKAGGQRHGEHATRTVIGPAQRGADQPHGSRRSRDAARGAMNGVEVARRDRLRQQRPPHVDARQLRPGTRLARAGSARRRPRRCWPARPGSARAPALRSAAPRRAAPACSRPRPGPPRATAAAVCARCVDGRAAPRRSARVSARVDAAAAARRARRLEKSNRFGKTTCTPTAQLARSRPRPRRRHRACRRVRAAAAREDARLQEQPWPRGRGQRFVAGTNGVDGRLRATAPAGDVRRAAWAGAVAAPQGDAWRPRWPRWSWRRACG